MRIALFGREPKTQNLPYIEVVVEKLFEEGAKLGVYSPLKDAVEQIKQEEFEKLAIQRRPNCDCTHCVMMQIGLHPLHQGQAFCAFTGAALMCNRQMCRATSTLSNHQTDLCTIE